MSNKTGLKENQSMDVSEADQLPEKLIDKEGKENTANSEVAKKKKKKHISSALVAASLGRSAVDRMKPHASRDISGSSGLLNSGPFVSYENEE
jgi:hypothetical protein